MKETPIEEQILIDSRAYQKLLARHEALQKCYHCGSVAEKIVHVVDHYHDTAVQAIEGAKQFRDRMIVDLRAFSMMLSSVGNAETHREKSPRLRGAIELVESAIKRLEQESFDISMCRRFDGFDDVFRSDYPNRHYKERIRQLEAELEALKPKEEPSSAAAPNL